MLYTHKLKDFSGKNAEIESTEIIRELKKKLSYPFSEQKMNDYFTLFFVSSTDKDFIKNAIQEIPLAIQSTEELLNSKDTVYEPLDLHRAIKDLRILPIPLQNNLQYAEELSAWQEQFVHEITETLNSFPRLKSIEEKRACNDKLNAIFEKILRSRDFRFNFEDIIHDKQTELVKYLNESMKRGFFFHITLEEEIKKLSFEQIKNRIPKDRLDKVEAIETKVEIIRNGVDRAYELNMRMVNLAVVLYSFIKWLSNR